MQNDIRNARGLLRRALFLKPDLQRVGGECAGLEEAVRAEGLDFDPGNPELWVVWKPGQKFTEPLPPGIAPRAVVVVAASIASPPLPREGSRQPARRATTLRDWVTGWPQGGLLRPFLAPDAVGARSCTVRMPGNTEWVFLAEPGNARPTQQSALREATVTFLGTGLFPIMPATLASAVMIPPAFAAKYLLGGAGFLLLSLAVALLATLASVLLESWAGRRFLASDPREFVLDEVAGMALTWALLPPSAGGVWLLAGFLCFRVFDIFKWGIAWIEKLPIRGRIVWDDLLAGLYAGLATLGLWALLS